MTEMELNLLLLRYNMLSKKRATTAYIWKRTGESVRDEGKWSECVNEMTKIGADLRRYGYKLAYADSKTAGKARYNVYKIIPINNH